MSWRVAPVAAAGDWEGPWDALNAALYRAHPLFDSRFTAALLACFGTGDERLAVRDGGTNGMVLLLPCRRGVYRTFLPSQLQAAPLLVAEAAALPSLLGALGRGALAIDLLCQDTAYTPLDEGRADPTLARSRHALTMNIALDGDFDRYWGERSANLRRNLRHYHNRLAAAGHEERLIRIDTPDELPAAVARYGAVEARGWKGKAGTAITASNRQGAFYARMLAEFARTGQACAYEYWLDDRLAASRLLISNDEIIVILKTTYDEELAALAPGRVLLHRILQHEFTASPGKRVELYTNATADQLRWATATRAIDHVTLYRNALIARGHGWWQRQRERLAPA